VTEGQLEYGRTLAKEIGASFKITSAEKLLGIRELFRDIGIQYINNRIKGFIDSDILLNDSMKTIRLEKTIKKMVNGRCNSGGS